MRFIKPQNLTQNSLILDVRSSEEYQTETIDLPHIHQDLETLDPLDFIKQHNLNNDQTINILCSSGGRASQAAEMFEKVGFNNVAVVIGGLVEAEYEGLNIVKH